MYSCVHARTDDYKNSVMRRYVQGTALLIPILAIVPLLADTEDFPSLHLTPLCTLISYEPCYNFIIICINSTTL